MNEQERRELFARSCQTVINTPEQGRMVSEFFKTIGWIEGDNYCRSYEYALTTGYNVVSRDGFIFGFPFREEEPGEADNYVLVQYGACPKTLVRKDDPTYVATERARLEREAMG